MITISYDKLRMIREELLERCYLYNDEVLCCSEYMAGKLIGEILGMCHTLGSLGINVYIHRNIDGVISFLMFNGDHIKIGGAIDEQN